MAVIVPVRPWAWARFSSLGEIRARFESQVSKKDPSLRPWVLKLGPIILFTFSHIGLSLVQVRAMVRSATA